MARQRPKVRSQGAGSGRCSRQRSWPWWVLRDTRGAPRVGVTKPKCVCSAMEQTQRSTHRGRQVSQETPHHCNSPNDRAINFIDQKRQECPSSGSPVSSPSVWVVFVVKLRNASQVMRDFFFLVFITPLCKSRIIMQCDTNYNNN